MSTGGRSTEIHRCWADGQLVTRSTHHSCFSVTSSLSVYWTLMMSWLQTWKRLDTCCLFAGATCILSLIHHFIVVHN